MPILRQGYMVNDEILYMASCKTTSMIYRISAYCGSASASMRLNRVHQGRRVKEQSVCRLMNCWLMGMSGLVVASSMYRTLYFDTGKPWHGRITRKCVVLHAAGAKAAARSPGVRSPGRRNRVVTYGPQRTVGCGMFCTAFSRQQTVLGAIREH